LLKIDEIGLSLLENKCDRNIYIDKHGYQYALSESNLNVIKRRNSVPAQFFRNNPFTIENIKNYLSRNCSTVKLISDSVETATEDMEFECNAHGIFKKTWNEIKNGAYCTICGRTKGNENRKRSIDEVKQGFENRGYLLLTDTYIDNETKMPYKCYKHIKAETQFIAWGGIVSGKGCKHCARESRIKKQTKSHSVFLSEIESLHGNKLSVTSKYVNSKTKVKVFCNDCNSQFSSKPNHLLDGHLGCNCRPVSLGEEKIRGYFEEQQIPFEQQYRFSDCRNKKPLPFDFAVFDGDGNLRCLIEFQGKQHYEGTTTKWSSDINKSIKAFEQQQINDNIKRNYCQKKKIKLVEIPYWKLSNIEQLLSELIKNII